MIDRQAVAGGLAQGAGDQRAHPPEVAQHRPAVAPEVEPGRPVVEPVTANDVNLGSEPQGGETAADGGEPAMEVAYSGDEDEATEPDVQAVAAE